MLPPADDGKWWKKAGSSWDVNVGAYAVTALTNVPDALLVHGTYEVRFLGRPASLSPRVCLLGGIFSRASVDVGVATRTCVHTPRLLEPRGCYAATYSCNVFLHSVLQC